MSFTAAEGRQEILEKLARAIGELSVGVESLGEAYELVDEQLADRLEDTVFRPLQLAYGRARKTYGDFAARHGVEAAGLVPSSSGKHDTDPRVYIQRASDAAEHADLILGELQDSMLPVEVGDRELRDGLAGVRELISSVPSRGRELVRSVGR